MKTLPVIAIVATCVAFAGITLTVTNASADTLCAEKARFGWKISGPDFSANYTDWQANKAIGQVIGDGNCQSGWAMVSSVDPRIQFGASKVVFDDVVVGTKTVTRTKTNTTSVFDGRKTLAFNGDFPSVIRNVDTGMRKRFIGVDSSGNGLYRTTKDGYFPKGTVQVWSKSKLADRDVKSGYSGANGHKMRYDQFKDVTTSHTFDAEVPVMGKERRVVSRTFCPSVHTWTFVAPSGEAVATTQGKVGECVTKIITQ
mgnify:FL=1